MLIVIYEIYYFFQISYKVRPIFMNNEKYNQNDKQIIEF